MDIRAYIESGVIESYVLGMADSQEAAELEQMCNQYPEVKKAMDAFEASLEKQALSSALRPEPRVKENILDALPDEFTGEEARPAKVVSFNRARYIAAASIVLLVASAALNYYYYNQYKSKDAAYQALVTEKNSLIVDNQQTRTRLLDISGSMQMMSDPAVIKVSMAGVAGKENNLATVFWDSRSKDVYLLPNKLADAPAGHQYQLWAIVDGKPVDAGMMDACTGLCKMKNIPAASAFAITLEKKGGSEVPTMDQMYVLGKVG